MSSAGGEQSTPGFREALPIWTKIGFLSFGGPAGQIALMHRILVDERRWIGERPFLSALNFCMLLPGPEAMQLATYVGWRLHGLKGALTAGLLFVLPGAAVILGLSMFYAAYGKTPLAEAVFLGVKAAVLAIVIEALLRVARRALRGSAEWAAAGAAFLAIFAFAVPFPVIVLAAALFGLTRPAPPGGPAPVPVSISLASTARTVGVWLVVWIAPLLAIVLVFGSDSVLAKLAWFFSKLAVVTFGGAYAVLAYMGQEVVSGYGWLTAGEMLDGLGLAETTPGPLILVTEFVGYIAAYRGGASVWMGILGALVVLWATFAPCFLWVLAGAPYIERLNAEPRLAAALRFVTAAVVGVILNLTVWFAVHVLFREVAVWRWGPVSADLPNLATIDPAVAGLALLAILLIFVLHRGVLTVLAVCAVLAVLISTLS